MGGVNQNRYGSTATTQRGGAVDHGHQGNTAGFASLPEYQHQASTKSVGSSSPNHRDKEQLRPRQHIVPAALSAQQNLYRHSAATNAATATSTIESPTPSQGSGSDSGSTGYHYNPYNLQCSRVPTHHVQQQVQTQQVKNHMCNQQQFPETSESDSREQSVGYDNRCYEEQQGYGGYGYQYEEYEEEQMMEEAPAKSVLPYGTLHGNLEGYVSFVPYPSEEFINPTKAQNHPVPCEGNMSRVFLGQLPYQVTDMQLDWLCFTFGNGGCVHFPERITKHDPMRGCKVPTGCIHGYVENDVVSNMLGAMHKRVLVDDTGVWYAEDPEQQRVLNDYCLMMKNDRTKRYQNRPYDTVVAQFATSSFVRRR